MHEEIAEGNSIPFKKPAPHLSLRDKYDVHPHTERSKNQSEDQGFP